MTRSPKVLKAGTRPSSLALAQTRTALDRIKGMLSGVSFEIQPITSVGDTDRTTDLRTSPADFFTRELDTALLAGEIDFAVHSAKDLPDPMPAGIDWFWLPWREEPRDALVLAAGKTATDLPVAPMIGVSSERRAAYCRTRFPNGIQKNIRGNIEERIAQVDHGDFDLIIMAAAGLSRLGMAHRITEWIPLDALAVPDGQGHLAITFRKGDERLIALRSLFMQAVTFAGSGVSNKELCTIATLRALQRCDICLYDSLIDPALLDELPPDAQAIDVGKRCGAHSKEQHETTRLLYECACQSKRVVRLKGGDPGIFGRLAEETEALENRGIPFRVIPGISALQAATTGTGMLLTRRNVSRGFVALTPRMSGGALARCDAAMKNQLPTIFYMSIRAIDRISAQLLEDGHAPETPVAIIYNAGGEDEQLFRMPLHALPQHAKDRCIKQPGLILVGDITTYGYQTNLGAMEGKKVLLTCSKAIQQKAVDLVRDLGGHPIQFPLIKLKCRQNQPLDCAAFDWLVVTSPSAVRAFMEIVAKQAMDYRSIPKIMVCGRGTARAFMEYGIRVDAQPKHSFSAEALKLEAQTTFRAGTSVLRIRSDKAGTSLADALRTTGAHVDEAIIYDNVRIEHAALPDFDAAFFASASGVESFIAQWGPDALNNKTTVVIGKPTEAALKQHQLNADVVAKEATIPSAIQTLAEHLVSVRLSR